MTYRDLEKEKWIRFENRNILNKKIKENELNKLVYETYKNSCKYCSKKINPNLKKRFDNLENALEEVNIIKKVFVLYDAKLGKRRENIEYNNFIVMETIDDNIVLNITTGEDYMFSHNKQLALYQNKTKIKELYTYNKDDYQEKFKRSLTKEIILHKDATMHNKINNQKINKSIFLEIVFENNYKIYIDIIYNRLYMRNDNYYLKNTKKRILLYKNKTNITLKKNIFPSKIYKELKITLDML